MYLNKLLPLFLIISVISACGEDEPKTPTYEKQYLIGRWELNEAWRGNKKTETLTGIFYEFDTKGKMHTNFTMDMTEGEFPYDFDGRTIFQKGPTDRTYAIDSLTNETLIFSTNFNDYQFKLALGKKMPIESEEETGL
ncbi:MAG: hypothetical protein R2825_05340 [Saprospiraceae bacterium]